MVSLAVTVVEKRNFGVLGNPSYDEVYVPSQRVRRWTNHALPIARLPFGYESAAGVSVYMDIDLRRIH